MARDPVDGEPVGQKGLLLYQGGSHRSYSSLKREQGPGVVGKVAYENDGVCNIHSVLTLL